MLRISFEVSIGAGCRLYRRTGAMIFINTGGRDEAATPRLKRMPGPVSPRCDTSAPNLAGSTAHAFPQACECREYRRSHYAPQPSPHEQGMSSDLRNRRTG